MADRAAEQGASPINQEQQGQGAEPAGAAEAKGERLENQIIDRLERVVRTTGATLRGFGARMRERRQSGEYSGSSEGAERLYEAGLQVPEEVRGLVERYPLQAMLASCGAGYLLGALMGGRRR